MRSPLESRKGLSHIVNGAGDLTELPREDGVESAYPVGNTALTAVRPNF
ncbi:hypothetical protein RSSM_01151 [Rhodopirellula sallentina SM41]|uniref:Uncharacterized protein n=1 Tax=Rhodopirellula sallentina SM41 TaxID=1263870 RepID=M5U7A4_9BACT|nr:hypothetical protein RSSM_01151 [Rhodopirellula sallentina SM41]